MRDGRKISELPRRVAFVRLILPEKDKQTLFPAGDARLFHLQQSEAQDSQREQSEKKQAS
jgi:hypothetical protein